MEYVKNYRVCHEFRKSNSKAMYVNQKIAKEIG